MLSFQLRCIGRVGSFALNFRLDLVAADKEERHGLTCGRLRKNKLREGSTLSVEASSDPRSEPSLCSQNKSHSFTDNSNRSAEQRNMTDSVLIHYLNLNKIASSSSYNSNPCDCDYGCVSAYCLVAGAAFVNV